MIRPHEPFFQTGNSENRPRPRLTGNWRERFQDGQNIVEFALVLPLLVMMLVGIVEFGRGMNAFITISQAAREGARSGIYLTSTDAGIRAAVRSQSASTLGNLPDEAITISPAAPRSSGDLLSVTVDYAFVPATPFFGTLIGGGSINLRAQARMRVQ